VAKAEIHELPTRPRMYLRAACLRLCAWSQGGSAFGEAEMKTAHKLGVTDEEIARLRAAVNEALTKQAARSIPKP